MVLRLCLTLANRGWPFNETTLGRGLQAAASQRAWDAVPRLLRHAAACGARAPAEALRALLMRCAGEQAWGAAEKIIQVGPWFVHAYLRC